MVTEIIIGVLFALGALLFIIWISLFDDYNRPYGIASAVCFILAIAVYCFGCNFRAETTTDSVPMRVIIMGFKF
jgi:uncharacterized BrkB/YihY/UPF0761 family membrane protein